MPSSFIDDAPEEAAGGRLQDTSVAYVDFNTTYQVRQRPEIAINLAMGDKTAIRAWTYKMAATMNITPALVHSAPRASRAAGLEVTQRVRATHVPSPTTGCGSMI